MIIFVGIVQTEDQKYKKDDDTKGTYRIVVGKTEMEKLEEV